MSTTDVSTPTDGATARHREPAGTPPARRARSERLTFAHVLASEWIKFRTLRSNWVLLAAVFVVIAGFGLVAAAVAGGSVQPAAPSGAPASGAPGTGGGDPLSTVLTGVNLAVLLVGVLGALLGAREYSSGMIRVTLAAVPRRGRVLAGKLLVFVAALVPVVAAGVLTAFFAGMALLSASGDTTVSWSDDGVARALLGNVAYLVGIGVLGLTLGLLLRGIASSIGILIGGVLILPNLAGALLPDDWSSVLQYLPAKAGSAFTSVISASDSLTAGPGALVFTAWIALAVAGAATALRRRDA